MSVWFVRAVFSEVFFLLAGAWLVRQLENTTLTNLPLSIDTVLDRLGGTKMWLKLLVVCLLENQNLTYDFSKSLKVLGLALV